ncbi:MAG: hypothetical protein SFV55_02280 [Haliscomenobacter sp.]|uniref:hypothetical protein n=1 Tax=Haliscomenobacter sp. TaxID=2717303 RepID=UPI0029A45735|nr:hypothetical protein [Haliscomenobacter sp.]MDX2067220.1 hypothetical protein [Haliscomenobacter sp.]
MKLQRMEFGDFIFSSITWQEISDKINDQNINFIRRALNENLKLNNYGLGVKEIGYIFVVALPTSSIHGETLRYYKAKQEVFIQKKLPYDLVEAYNGPQVLSLMAATYLQSLEQLAKRKIPDFDGARLVADVKGVFEQQGWLVRMEAVASA